MDWLPVLGTLLVGALVLVAMMGMGPSTAKAKTTRAGLQPKEGWHKH
jgi:hypothetical protein